MCYSLYISKTRATPEATMTKTEAAEIIATDVRVFARKLGYVSVKQIDKNLVEARISELRGPAGQGLQREAAQLATWRTTLTAARKYAL